MNISEWIESGKPWNVILHGDCMDLMKHFNDKEIPLCIVDPPYGIDITNQSQGKGGGLARKNEYKNNCFDKNIFQIKYILMNCLEFQKIKLYGAVIILLNI